MTPDTRTTEKPEPRTEAGQIVGCNHIAWGSVCECPYCGTVNDMVPKAVHREEVAEALATERAEAAQGGAPLTVDDIAGDLWHQREGWHATEGAAPRAEGLDELRKIGPPDTHCASDCCDAYPRLHVHGDHDEWNAILARLSGAPRQGGNGMTFMHDPARPCDETCDHPRSTRPAAPTTEASAQFLRWMAEMYHWHPIDGRRDTTARYLADIEAEARAASQERPQPACTCDGDPEYCFAHRPQERPSIDVERLAVVFRENGMWDAYAEVIDHGKIIAAEYQRLSGPSPSRSDET